MKWATERQKDVIKILNKLGMNDGDIAYITLMSITGVRRIRVKFKLPNNGTHTKWTNDRRRKTCKITNYCFSHLKGRDQQLSRRLGWPNISLSEATILETLRRLSGNSYDTNILLKFVNKLRDYIKRKPLNRSYILQKLSKLNKLGFIETFRDLKIGTLCIHKKTELIYDCWENPNYLKEICDK